MMKLLVVLSITAAGTCAHASDYGCKVLLCLANPASNGGPKGMTQCEQPINQLYHDLSKGRPFPSCDLSDGNDGSSYARQVYDQYDPCPTPLHAVLRGSYVTEGRRKTNSATGYGWGGDGSFVLTKPLQVSEQGEYDNSPGARACVGKLIGSYTAGSFDNPYTVNVFDTVIWQPAQTPRAIDVFIDHTWQQRVRW
ncbi:hypothetical protein [Caballeronia humi]|uniref:Uncharacterized protein n=1 Tax=Caballeronia humi TaxID=326474 RepID=A0A158IVI5_9BURK|nr:hypothetical protein [Caballeronia humi]SAL60110.1 hypothetical protein AWB65_05411 [Caballeronia humi]